MPKQKRVAVIIVFDVKRATHFGRVLQHKAKRAQVIAAANVNIKSGVLKLNAQLLPKFALAAQNHRRAIALNLKCQLWLGGVKLRVNHVAQGVAIERPHAIARAKPRLRRRAIGLDGFDNPNHCLGESSVLTDGV